MRTLKKYPFLYEAPLFYLVIYGVNRFFFPDLPGFVGRDPHPYWVGVLAFGFRYGAAAGLFSGIVAAGLYLGTAWFAVERYLFEDFFFYVLPLCFALVGLLVGIGVRRYRWHLGRLEGDKETLEKNVTVLKDEIRVLQEINKGLEQKIVTRMSTLVTLYEGARRLESADLQTLYHTILEFVAKALDADEVAFYLRTPDGWELKDKIGWKEYVKRPTTLRFHEGITGMAGARGSIVTIRDFLGGASVKDMPQMMGDSIVAGPLRKGEDGEVIGVIGIQAMPFLNFNSASVNLFHFLLNWASRAVERAFFVQGLKDREIVDPEYQIFSVKYFQSRLAQEFSRSKTYYLPLSLGLVEVNGLEGLNKKAIKLALTAISQLAVSFGREMDVVARYDDGNIHFAILWVTAGNAQAIAMREKILNGLKQLDIPQVSVRIGLSSFTPQTASAEALVEAAMGDLGHATSRAATS